LTDGQFATHGLGDRPKRIAEGVLEAINERAATILPWFMLTCVDERKTLGWVGKIGAAGDPKPGSGLSVVSDISRLASQKL
jgi:hypothetical protein